MFDTNGRKYAPISDVRAGTKIQVDDGFTCANEDEIFEVSEDEEGLYFPCSEGSHYLDGQISDDETHYVGVYLVED